MNYEENDRTMMGKIKEIFKDEIQRRELIKEIISKLVVKIIFWAAVAMISFLVWIYDGLPAIWKALFFDVMFPLWLLVIVLVLIIFLLSKTISLKKIVDQNKSTEFTMSGQNKRRS